MYTGRNAPAMPILGPVNKEQTLPHPKGDYIQHFLTLHYKINILQHFYFSFAGEESLIYSMEYMEARSGILFSPVYF